MESPDVIEELQDKIQNIQCHGNDLQEGFSLYGENVVVTPSTFDDSESDNASNKIRVSQVSKFDWEEKFYFGNLLSCNSKFMAYILRPKGSQEYHIRVLNQHTSDRVLIRGFKNEIVDVCFESIQSNRLACVDIVGNVFVYNIYENEGNVKYSPVVIINNDKTNEKEKLSHRVVWAPSLLIPAYDYEPMLAVSSGSNVEVFHLKKLKEGYSNEVFNRSDIDDGVIEVNDGHTDQITSLALSPDTNVLATASKDGCVKFWSVNFDTSSPPACLHEWEPHDKEPVTSLFFCDNLLLSDDKSPFWRFLITGSANNSIFKIWCAVKWECVQTIKFAPYSDSNELPQMKALLDISAKFFVVCDVYKQVLYILKLHQDNIKDKLTFITLNEFIIKEPLLSFAIHVAKDKKHRQSSAGEGDNENHLANGTSYEEEDSHEHLEEKSAKSIMSTVTLFAIQKKALQKLSVKFKATMPLELPIPSISTSSVEDATSIQDGLSDITDISESMSQLGVNQLESDKDEPTSPLPLSSDLKKTFPTITPDNDLLKSSIVSSVLDDDSTLIDVSTNFAKSKSPEMFPSDSVESLPNEKSINKDNELTKPFESTEDLSKENEPVIDGHVFSKRSHIDSLLLTDQADSGVNINLASQQTTGIEDEESKDDPSKDTLLKHITKQQSTIDNLQKELQEIKFLLTGIAAKQSSESSNNSFNREQIESDRNELKVNMQLLQKSAQLQFSKANKEFNKVCTHKIEEFTQALQCHSQAKEERTIQTLSNIVSNTIGAKLEKILRHEVKQVILPTLEKALNKHLEHSSNSMAQKISALERTMKEETHDLLKSKQFSDSMGSVTANVLEKTLPTSYRESFQNILIPGFEKSLMSMYMQINQAFQQGTKQYMEKLENHMESRRSKLQDNQEPLISSLQDLVHSFQGTADRLTSGVETNLEALMQKQLADTTDRMQNNFVKSIESRVLPILSQSISKCANDSFNTWRSKIDETLIQIMQGTGRPVQTEESLESKKNRVVQYIESGDYTNAFELALTASSLQLVMYVCKQVDPTDLFQQDNNGQLPQPIILSLIQQLSVNLDEDTDIKNRYLQESIMALDKSNDITKEHMPAVLQSLNEQLSATIETIPKSDGKRMKPLRMLLMASRSLLRDD